MIVADTPLRRCLRRLPGARMKRAATSDNVDGGAWNAAAPLCATRAYCLFNCVQLEHTDHFGPLHRSHHTRTNTRTHHTALSTTSSEFVRFLHPQNFAAAKPTERLSARENELPLLLLRRSSRLAAADPGAQGRDWAQQVHLEPPVHIEPQERLQHLWPERLQSGRRCRRRLCPLPVGSPSLRDAAARAAAGERRVGGDKGVESPACDGGARGSAGGEPDGLAHIQLPAAPRPGAHSSHALRARRWRAWRARARRRLAPLPL